MQLIQVDGTFLKTNFKHQLLAAVGIDSFGKIYPIAIAIVSIENISNWNFFMINLRKSFDNFDIDFNKLIFVSDREKGLLNSIDAIFPETENFYCTRHLGKNLKQRYKSPEGISLFFYCAKILEKDLFIFYFNKLKTICFDLYTELLNLGIEKWSVCNNRLMLYNYNCSNLIESFNKSIQKKEN